ncbi:extracellular glycoprotein lacritin precursor, partial [Daubentonia madagascariensis]
MRFTTLLFLAALAGALVCAEDAPSDHTKAAPIQDTATPIPHAETTAPAAPQETTTSTAPQKTTQATLGWQELIPMRSLVEKSLTLAENSFQGAGKELHGKLQSGKKFVD